MALKTVLPSEDFTQHKFVCPKCEWPWWFTVAQLNTRRIIHVCDCGAVFKPRLEETLKEKEEVKKDHNLVDLVVLVIAENLGCTREEARNKVNSVYSPEKDMETLLHDAFFYNDTI